MMMKCLSNAFLTLAMLPAAILAADWPSFRGNPQQTGVAASTLPNQLELLWKFHTKDAIESTAAIVGDTVYVTSMDHHLYALSLKRANKELWKYKATEAISASPAVKDGAVYFGDLDGTFHCVDIATRAKRWTFKTDAEITSSANFEGSKVLFGSNDGHLYCLDAKGGALLWKIKTEGPIECSPVIIAGRAFVTGCDPNLLVVNIADGKELPALELGLQGVASAAAVGSSLYVGNDSKNSVLGIDWKEGKVLWEYQNPERQAPFHSSAAVKDDLVVIGGQDKMVHAIDRMTGEGKWTFLTWHRVDSSPVIIGDRVFIGSNDGSLYSLELKTGKKIWEQPLGAKITASPAVGGNRLIIGTGVGIVYCFGAK